MGSVAIFILVDVTSSGGYAPRTASLELGVIDLDTGTYDVRVDAFTTGRIVLVDRVCIIDNLLAVGDARKTLRDNQSQIGRPVWRNLPTEQSPEFQERER